MKKLASILVVMMLIGAASAAYAADGKTQSAGNVNYSDLKSTNWAYGAVSTMSEKGIVKGYQDGSFKPANTVTYGEFIKMALIAATGEDVGNSTEGNWAKGYYNKAVELGYFSQNAITESQLNLPIPRCDMALIISHILGAQKIENYGELEDSLGDIDLTVKHEYDIIKSYASGIITGYEDNTFRPEKTLTRAEGATVIYRLTDESKRVLPESDANAEGKLLLKNFMDTSTLSIMRSGEYASEDYVIKTAEEMGITMLKDNGKDGFSFWLIPEQYNRGAVAIKDGKAVVDCIQRPSYDDNVFEGKYMIACRNYAKEDIDYFLITSYQDKYTSIIVKNPFK